MVTIQFLVHGVTVLVDVPVGSYCEENRKVLCDELLLS